MWSGKQFDEILRQRSARELSETADEMRMQKAVNASKAAFYQCESTKKLSSAEFLYQQSRYIGKCWWLLQGALLLLLLLVMQDGYSSKYLYRCMGAAAPLFVILLVPELWKNRMTDAMEVESATLYSLRQIYAARFVILSAVDFLMLSGFLWAACSRLSLWTMVIHFLLPMLVSCCLCFHTLYSRSFGSELFAVLLCILWAVVWMQIILWEQIYNAISVPMWCGMLVLSGLYLGYCIAKGQKQWNQIWERKPVWN